MIVKLKPALKKYLWGGEKLKSQYNKDGCGCIAESWELSFNGEGLSVIADGEHLGKPLADVVTPRDLGANVNAFPFFPALVKLIDSSKPLSVQVHPSDEYALKKEGQYGKTEMWHILQAEKDAYVYLGFKRDVTISEFESAVQNGSVCSLLNKVNVADGDTYFIPSGTIHAIGGGITLVEIQQNSALTYRVYDYGRVDSDGCRRELHLDKAKSVINYSKYTVPSPDRSEFLGGCKYFKAYKYAGAREICFADSFCSVTALTGEITVGGLCLKSGDTAFVSAGERTRVIGSGSYLLVYVDKQ